MQLHEHLIGDFGGKGFIGVGVLDQVKDGRVIQVGVSEEERLPHLVVSQIPEVFRCQSQLVDGAKLRVRPFNQVLFDALHTFFSLTRKKPFFRLAEISGREPSSLTPRMVPSSLLLCYSSARKAEYLRSEERR